MPGVQSSMTPEQRAHVLLRTSFWKRRKTIEKKCNELHKKCGVPVYFATQYLHQWHEFTTDSSVHFPPPRAELAIGYPVPKVKTPHDFGSGLRSSSKALQAAIQAQVASRQQQAVRRFPFQENPTTSRQVAQSHRQHTPGPCDQAAPTAPLPGPLPSQHVMHAAEAEHSPASNDDHRAAGELEDTWNGLSSELGNLSDTDIDIITSGEDDVDDTDAEDNTDAVESPSIPTTTLNTFVSASFARRTPSPQLLHTAGLRTPPAAPCRSRSEASSAFYHSVSSSPDPNLMGHHHGNVTTNKTGQLVAQEWTTTSLPEPLVASDICLGSHDLHLKDASSDVNLATPTPAPVERDHYDLPFPSSRSHPQRNRRMGLDRGLNLPRAIQPGKGGVRKSAKLAYKYM